MTIPSPSLSSLPPPRGASFPDAPVFGEGGGARGLPFLSGGQRAAAPKKPTPPSARSGDKAPPTAPGATAGLSAASPPLSAEARAFFTPPAAGRPEGRPAGRPLLARSLPGAMALTSCEGTVNEGGVGHPNSSAMVIQKGRFLGLLKEEIIEQLGRGEAKGLLGSPSTRPSFRPDHATRHQMKEHRTSTPSGLEIATTFRRTVDAPPQKNGPRPPRPTGCTPSPKNGRATWTMNTSSPGPWPAPRPSGGASPMPTTASRSKKNGPRSQLGAWRRPRRGNVAWSA
jgi:hypothetical protein